MEIINWHGLTRLFYKIHCFFTTAVSLIKLKPCKSVPKTYPCLKLYKFKLRAQSRRWCRPDECSDQA